MIPTVLGRLSFCVLLLCASQPVLSAWFEKETPGERFRKAMKTREQWCASHKPVANDTSCEILKLKPADPMATPEGRYAHSIRVPLEPIKDVFTKGMSSEEYFARLCKTFGGEFVYKRVSDAAGVRQMRVRERPTDYSLKHLYALEDPYGLVTEPDSESLKRRLVRPSRYKFLEYPAISNSNASAGSIRRVKGTTPSEKTDVFVELTEETVNGLGARYGYTWRGVEVPHGREHGIVGSELLILSLNDGEVLAVRRAFIRSGDVPNSFTGIWWLGGHICPHPAAPAINYTVAFLINVLQPTSNRAGDAHATVK
jgi:hypothetical protein